MKKLVLAAVSSVSGLLSALGPLDTLEMTVTRTNGSVETRTVRLAPQPDGALRFRLPTIDMTPDFKTVRVVNLAGRRHTGDPGWWMINDGRWGAFTRTSGTTVHSPLRLPIAGMKTGEHAAWMAIVKGGRFETSNNLVVSNGVYEMDFTLRVSTIGFNPYEDWIIDYYPLAGADATYSGMGRVYRTWQLERGEVKPLRERVKGNPNLAYAADSIFLRCKFGRCDRTKTGPDDWLKEMPPVLVEQTFASFKDIMRRCHEAGIDKSEMCFVGFQPKGHDGPFPDLFPADERFGGEAGMRDAIAYGKSLGYHMDCHINQNNFYRNAKRWNFDDVAKDLKGNPIEYTVYPGGQVYWTCKEVICNKYMDKDIADMKDLGLNGLFHVDVTSATQPNVCHDPRHPNNRARMADWQIKMGLKARAAFGGFSSECGIDHVAPVLDNVLYASSYPGWHSKKTDLVDGYFPVWHVVYSGIMMSNPFYATIDASCPRDSGSGKTDAVGKSVDVTSYLDTPANRTLKVFELNGRPMFYYTDYKDISPIADMYRRWKPLRHLQFEFLEDHAEIATDVFRSRYSNGEEVVCNYRDEPFGYRGRMVPPKNYERYVK